MYYIFVLTLITLVSANNFYNYEEFARFLKEKEYNDVTDFAINNGFPNFAQTFAEFKVRLKVN